MNNSPIHIPFKNHQNPKSAFDIIRLEEVLRREGLDHSPEQLHVVEFYMIILIEEGSGVHTIDFTDYPCEKGPLLTVRKDQLHGFTDGRNMKGIMLLFQDEFVISYLEKLEAQQTLQLFNELLGAPKIQLSAPQFQEMASLLQRMNQEYFKVNDAYSLSIVRSELHVLIMKLYRIKTILHPQIKNRSYLEDFIAFQTLVEKNVTTFSKVLDYAKMLGISSKTLNTVTRSIVNKSAKAFIDEIYLMQIKRLLINTDDSVKEIAYSVGFEEVSNFYKYFKRGVQLTPEQFRKEKK